MVVTDERRGQVLEALAAFFVLAAFVTMPGCSQSGRSARLAELVYDLGALPLGPSDLGMPIAISSDTTEKIVAHGEAAVPQLVAALDSGNPVRVGYAAYCLEQLRAAKGEAAAKGALRKWDGLQNPTFEERFAQGCLREYLDAIATVIAAPRD